MSRKCCLLRLLYLLQSIYFENSKTYCLTFFKKANNKFLSNSFDLGQLFMKYDIACQNQVPKLGNCYIKVVVGKNIRQSGRFLTTTYKSKIIIVIMLQ
jgi:hypothetical protein